MIMPVDPPERVVLTYSQVHSAIRHYASGLKPGQFDRIIAVARGGLVPAAIMAHALSIRRVETVCFVSYDDEHKQSAPVLVGGLPRPCERTLIVDDIIDTGKTVAALRHYYPVTPIVALISRVDSFRGMLPNKYPGAWIVFPWESPVA